MIDSNYSKRTMKLKLKQGLFPKNRWIGAVVVLFLFGTRLTIETAVGDELADQLRPLIEGHEGEVSVCVEHLATGQRFAWEADRPMPTASLIKLPVMIAAYEAVANGKLDLTTPITLTTDDMVPGSGVLTDHFSAGTQISLRDAIHLMIAFSDNTATNLVVDRIGLATTAERMESLGYPNTKLHSKVFRGSTTVFPERSREFGLGSTTAAEMVGLLKMLHSKELVSIDACDDMLRHLRACDDDTKIRSLLPKGTPVANKTGAVSNVRTDAAVIESPNGTIVICVLTRNNVDQRYDDDNAAHVLCGRIGKIVFDHFNPGVVSTTQPVTGPLAIGATSQLVETLQRTLNARLLPTPNLTVDGDFGPATQNAVKSFQEANGLPASGVVDVATWKNLSPLVEKESVPEPEIVNAEVLPRLPADSDTGPPFVTAKAWCVIDAITGKSIGGENMETPLDPASTTKIMTALLILEEAERNPACLDEIVTFSAQADATIGSSCGLVAGEQVAVRDLLYGLLLPSGNDAGTALAEHFGAKWSVLNDDQTSKPVDSFAVFIQAMNRRAQDLGVKDSRFANPHGLTENEHKLSAFDLAQLTQQAIKLRLFRTIVATRQYGCRISHPSGYSRNVKWTNTNKMLETTSYLGVKTGTTTAAGACLVTFAEHGEQQRICVVLGASDSSSRYVDTKNLLRWSWGR
ncbi:MAG: serine hydrolase [Pirellulaceae bacterium]|nr:serine hydrolase [Pirellulaceae bacterium]